MHALNLESEKMNGKLPVELLVILVVGTFILVILLTYSRVLGQKIENASEIVGPGQEIRIFPELFPEYISLRIDGPTIVGGSNSYGWYAGGYAVYHDPGASVPLEFTINILPQRDLVIDGNRIKLVVNTDLSSPNFVGEIGQISYPIRITGGESKEVPITLTVAPYWKGTLVLGAYVYDAEKQQRISSQAWSVETPIYFRVKCNVTLYSGTNYGGSSLTLESDAPNLTEYSGPCNGNWNDCARSIAVPRWCGVIIYEHVGFKGASTRLCDSVADLSSYGSEHWNDVISSVKVESLPGISPRITLYQDVNFKGEKLLLTQSVSNLESIAGPCKPWPWASSTWNDCVSSIEVYPEDSGLVRVYVAANYGGGELQVCTQLPDLRNEKAPCEVYSSEWYSEVICDWNQKISSIKIDKSYTCYPCT